jgi:hypothetical protein
MPTRNIGRNILSTNKFSGEIEFEENTSAKITRSANEPRPADGNPIMKQKKDLIPPNTLYGGTKLDFTSLLANVCHQSSVSLFSVMFLFSAILFPSSFNL